MFQFLRSALSSVGGRRRPRPGAQPSRPRWRPTLEGLEDRLALSASPVSLGTASQYGVLGLTSTQIKNSNVTVTGDVGVSQGGKLTNMAPSTITGNVYAYASGQYSGPGELGGSVSINPTLLAQNNTDALNAAVQAKALAPTQTLGTVGSPTTVTGNGDLNVIAVNGDIKNSLTLTGSASDVFIVNVTGSVSLGGSSALGVGGGVTADHVLYNFTGASGSIVTHVGNVLNGTLLAPTYSFSLDGLFNGEIIGGGKSITLLSGAEVNEVPFNPPSSPQTEMPTASLSGSVYLDADMSGTLDLGEGGLSGWYVLLTGTDSLGHTVSLTTLTAGNDGAYSFTNLAAGTYQVSVSDPRFGSPSWWFTGASVGTAGGTLQSDGSVASITLAAGDQGVNYNFGEYQLG